MRILVILYGSGAGAATLVGINPLLGSLVDGWLAAGSVLNSVKYVTHAGQAADLQRGGGEEEAGGSDQDQG